MSRMNASVFPGARRNISKVGMVIPAAASDASSAFSFAADGAASAAAHRISERLRNIRSSPARSPDRAAVPPSRQAPRWVSQRHKRGTPARACYQSAESLTDDAGILEPSRREDRVDGGIRTRRRRTTANKTQKKNTP